MDEHIQRLQEIAGDTLKQKKIERLRQKLTERAQDIKDAPYSQMMDFYCTECHRDFGAIGFKEVRVPKGSVWFAWYEAHCPEGHKNLRYITDKIEDPYFVQSPFVRAQQEEFEDAQIPPWHPRFKVLYPLQHAALKAKQYEGELTRLSKKYD